MRRTAFRGISTSRGDNTDQSLGLTKILIASRSSESHSRIYRKKQSLYYEGMPVVGVYGVQTGKVKVFKVCADGRQHILRIAGPGEVIALESAMAGDLYQSTAEMIEDGIIWFFDKENVIKTVQQDPHVSLAVIQSLAEEVQLGDEERLELARNSVRERMARLLTTLSDDYGVFESRGVRIKLLLSREELAEMIGTVAETAMRLLKEFREDALVEVHGREILVLDRNRLLQAAHMDA